MQSRLQESKKKIQLMKNTPQNLIRGTLNKATNTWKSNYKNNNNKDKGSTSKEGHALGRYSKHTPINTAYT